MKLQFPDGKLPVGSIMKIEDETKNFGSKMNLDNFINKKRSDSENEKFPMKVFRR